MKKLFTHKWFYITALLLAAGWWWFGSTGGNKTPTNAVRVTVAPATRQDVPTLVPLVGTVIAYETVSIKSRLDSQIVAVMFRDGEYVKEGQVLFKLDDRAIKADINQFEASLNKEQANLINDKLQFERMQKLIKTHAVSQLQYDDAKASYDSQVAQVKVAQANLDNARVQLTYATITAPIGGRTGTINITRGNNVKANDATPLVTINQVSPIRVQFSTPQRYYDQVKAAKTAGNVVVTAQSKESKESVEGQLEYVDNNIDVSNGTFVARAIFPNTDEKLWPGMFVNVSLNLGVEKNALTIPSVAIQGDENNHFVFVADTANKKAVRKPVGISQNNGDIAIITQGLADNEQIIVDGLLRLTDGAAIDIVVPESPKP